MLCLDLKRRLYESKLVFGIQVISSDSAVKICMVPHCYLLLCKLAITPHHTVDISTAAVSVTIGEFELKMCKMLSSTLCLINEY